MVEMTLVWNHAVQVLSGNQTIATPGQLLPLLIGALGLLRIVYFIFKDKIWGAGEQEEETHDHGGGEDRTDTENVKDRNRLLRYLVAWLPWLSDTPLWLGYGEVGAGRHKNSFTLDMITPVRTRASGLPEKAPFERTTEVKMSSFDLEEVESSGNRLRSRV